MNVDIYNEFDIVQNNLIGAHVLHEFVKVYTDQSGGVGPKLYWLFPVLPIVFHEDSVSEIYARALSQGSFLKVVNSNAYLFMNLQERMEVLSTNTFKCISIACDAGLFGYDAESARIYLITSKAVVNDIKQLGDNYQKIVLAAKRLGHWFAKMAENELLIYLNIKF
jgi:hypothetical protein